MSEGPFIPFYTSDFLAGTSGMTSAVKGVYITLLCLMYEAESPLPQKWDTLARRCGCTLPAFQKAVEALEDDRKLTVTSEGIWSEKCDPHITQRRERQASAKAAAKKRWEKTQQKQRGGDADALSPQCKPEPEPYTEEEAERVRVPARPPDLSTDDPPPDAKPPDEPPGDEPSFFEQVLAMAGHTNGKVPTYWMPPAAEVEVNGWLSRFRLTEDEIIETVASTRKAAALTGKDPPRGPKAFETALQRLADAKARSNETYTPNPGASHAPSIANGSGRTSSIAAVASGLAAELERRGQGRQGDDDAAGQGARIDRPGDAPAEPDRLAPMDRGSGGNVEAAE